MFFYFLREKTLHALLFEFEGVLPHVDKGHTQNRVRFSAATPLQGTSNGVFEAEGFKLEWTDTQLTTQFKFEYQQQAYKDLSNTYAAFGLSYDRKMGDDDVIACKYSNGLGSIQRYYNNGQRPQLLPDPLVGLSETQVSIQDNLLKCSFKRVKSMPSEPNYFDLNKEYYVLLATGPTAGS